MQRKTHRKTVLAVFLASTMLVSTPFAAAAEAPADRTAALEKRVAELEAILARLTDKMDVQEVTITQQQERIARTEAVVAKPAPAPVAKKEDGFTVGNTRVKLGGYVKADVVALKNTAGAPAASADISRDFYIPGTTPVGGAASDWTTDFSARQSRLFFTTESDFGGEKVGTRIEMDFMVTAGGDERVSNSYSPRLRQAYVTYGHWLAGQAWSTFQDVDTLPDSLDFIGTTEGTIFVRQPMIRYTNGGFQLALEQPEGTLTTWAGARALSGSDPMPDVVARYNHKGDWGQISLSGIARNISADAGTAGLVKDASVMGYGVSFAGKLKLGQKDDFRFMATAGKGLGRYIGINIVNDAAVDLAGTDLEAIATYSGFGAFRHVWTPKVRSNLMFAYFKADNPVALTTAGVTDQVWSGRANLIYSPVPNLDFGVEYGYSKRKLESGIDGAQHRLQFSSKFSF